MQTPAKLLGLALLSLLAACPKPTPPKAPSLPPPNQRALRGLMQQADMRLKEAGPVPSALSAFLVPAGGVAEAMRATRDLYAPEPGFYRLADEAFRAATESVEQRDPERRAQAWRDTQQSCQRCHLRYGGPKTYTDPQAE